MSFWTFGDETMRYLNGQAFSDSHRTAMATVRTTPAMTDRLALLEDYAAGKNVLHVGCCDHVELIREKIAKDIWVHGRISQVAKKCIGIDIDQDAIAYVIANFNVDNVFAMDITKERPDFIDESHWDIMMLPDVIEHINDPVDFLRKIRQIYCEKIDEIVISTPNAFWVHNLLASIKSYEIINSDHRYVFTPYTLAKVMMSAGFRIKEFTMVSTVPWKETGRRHHIVKKLVYRRFPVLGHVIVMNAAFGRPSGLGALDS